MGGINKGGRPTKFNENELLQTVKEYINNEHDKSKPIKITKLAKSLKDKGLNIVYQDLSRYTKVKKFINEYNIKLSSESPKILDESTSNNISPREKNNIGRPRKFDEDELLIAVKGYVRSFNRPEMIKVTKVAKYFQNKGLKITYQDLNRYKKVSEFIQNYNKKYKEVLFSGIVEVDIEKQTPIFEHIDSSDFFKKNKTPEQIKKSLSILNQTNEKLVESYQKLQDKIIVQNEKIIIQANEIENLRNEIELLKLEAYKCEQELKLENKKLKDNININARKMAMYEEFINRYHYANLAEYAINLEHGCSNENLKRLDSFFDVESYLQGNFRLKDVANKYAALSLSIDNATHEYLEENQYNLETKIDEELHYKDLNKIIDEENYRKVEENSEKDLEDDKKIDKLNLTIEDIDSSLSFLDEI